jgi:hypothetical protein
MDLWWGNVMKNDYFFKTRTEMDLMEMGCEDEM